MDKLTIRDLSKTSLEALPTEGLENLEILRIENTHTLKTIPSVYNFKVHIENGVVININKLSFSLQYAMSKMTYRSSSNFFFSMKKYIYFFAESQTSMVNTFLSLLCIQISIKT